MNINPVSPVTKPNDEQDLAKALAGVLDTPAEKPAQENPALGELQFEDMPSTPVIQLPTEEPTAQDAPATNTPIIAPAVEEPAPFVAPAPLAEDTGLEAIKNKALDELRPLINRADIPAEEKFDTYLMLIRSTDDSSLIGPAHEAALSITDETRKAEALIDVIKEIDYLSKKEA